MGKPGIHNWSSPRLLLVATDLADIDRLFSHALEQARESGASILLLHVLTVTQAMALDLGGMPYYDPMDAIRCTEGYLSPYATQARVAGVNCDVLVREGAAPQQILACAEHWHVDRVLLGTRSRSKWGKLFLGSVAEQVLRSSPVPVLTIGPEAHERVAAEGDVRTILHATSLGQASRASAVLACEVAEATKARLVLLHVLLKASSYAPRNEQLRSHAERVMKALVPTGAEERLDIEWRVLWGDPATETLGEARRRHAELIVLGAARLPALGPLARDGVAHGVIAHAPCPVLTLCVNTNQRDHEAMEADDHVAIA